MSISITPAANERMRHFLAATPAAVGEGDRLVDVDGVPLIVNDKNLALVEGTVIDFQRQGLNASFVFHNPNATGECGCGESFTVG